jgi:hypothetical protein
VFPLLYVILLLVTVVHVEGVKLSKLLSNVQLLQAKYLMMAYILTRVTTVNQEFTTPSDPYYSSLIRMYLPLKCI